MLNQFTIKISNILLTVGFIVLIISIFSSILAFDYDYIKDVGSVKRVIERTGDSLALQNELSVRKDVRNDNLYKTAITFILGLSFSAIVVSFSVVIDSLKQEKQEETIIE